MSFKRDSVARYLYSAKVTETFSVVLGMYLLLEEVNGWISDNAFSVFNRARLGLRDFITTNGEARMNKKY
jgi:hypothetical protein